MPDQAAVAQMVRDAVALELDARFPAADTTTKRCSQCGQELPKQNFTTVAWRYKEPVCKVCRPPDQKMTKRTKHEKACAKCGLVKKRDDFTTTQWQNGAASKCKACSTESALAEKKRTKVCRSCQVLLPKEHFSNTQWQLNAQTGSSCKACCANAKKATLFGPSNQPNLQDAPQKAQSPIWETEGDIDEARRWLLHCPMTALPSALLGD